MLITFSHISADAIIFHAAITPRRHFAIAAVFFRFVYSQPFFITPIFIFTPSSADAYARHRHFSFHLLMIIFAVS